MNERIHGRTNGGARRSITANLAKLLGAGEGGSPEETFWAVRRFFEVVVDDQPLVVVFDDIHWGEETFLDLIEHIADWSRDAQILLLCMAAPDLLDERPAWSVERRTPRRSRSRRSPNAKPQVIDHLLGEAGLPAQVRARIAEVAEGNPLFVEEMFRM